MTRKLPNTAQVGFTNTVGNAYPSLSPEEKQAMGINDIVKTLRSAEDSKRAYCRFTDLLKSVNAVSIFTITRQSVQHNLCAVGISNAQARCFNGSVDMVFPHKPMKAFVGFTGTHGFFFDGASGEATIVYPQVVG